MIILQSEDDAADETVDGMTFLTTVCLTCELSILQICWTLLMVVTISHLSQNYMPWRSCLLTALGQW